MMKVVVDKLNSTFRKPLSVSASSGETLKMLKHPRYGHRTSYNDIVMNIQLFCVINR